MRYQALLLIAVIFLSVTVMKGFPFLAKEGETETLTNAGVVEVVNMSGGGVRSVALETPLDVRPSVSVQADYAEEQTQVSGALSNGNQSQEGETTDACEAIGSSVAYAREMKIGSVLYERNISRRWPIASITKLMTAVVSIEKYDTSALVQISAEDIAQSEGFVTFSQGTTLSVNDMIRALLVASSNDAAFALARLVGQEEFVGRMQAKAQELGMSQTTFYEPSGLSYLNQSTASDLYALVRYIQTAHPYLLESTRLKTITVQDLGQKKRKTVANVNQFAGRSNFLGGKTGFIDQSGGNLVSMFRVDDGDVFLVVLGSNDRFGETEKLLQCVTE